MKRLPIEIKNNSEINTYTLYGIVKGEDQIKRQYRREPSEQDAVSTKIIDGEKIQTHSFCGKWFRVSQEEVDALNEQIMLAKKTKKPRSLLFKQLQDEIKEAKAYYLRTYGPIEVAANKEILNDVTEEAQEYEK